MFFLAPLPAHEFLPQIVMRTCVFLQKLGYTALHAGVDSGHFDVVNALLDAGSDANVRRVGTLDTPAHIACSSAGIVADVAIVMLGLLRSRGADFRLVNHVHANHYQRHSLSSNFLTSVAFFIVLSDWATSIGGGHRESKAGAGAVLGW
jgi:ankyrin repeat protein